ncbi:MAG: helix-turn-helix transcriptional regulator [Chloroflexi bacterium]|nr:helix-turn-helix transcriptional regulator [Chloroflexota bacterium]
MEAQRDERVKEPAVARSATARYWRQVGERARAWRIERRWSQSQLAKRSALPVEAIEGLERGDEPGHAMVPLRVAEALEVEPARLLLPESGDG